MSAKRKLTGYKPELKIRGVGQAYIETDDLVKTDEYKRQVKAVSEIRKMREREEEKRQSRNH